MFLFTKLHPSRSQHVVYVLNNDCSSNKHPSNDLDCVLNIFPNKYIAQFICILIIAVQYALWARVVKMIKFGNNEYKTNNHVKNENSNADNSTLLRAVNEGSPNPMVLTNTFFIDRT